MAVELLRRAGEFERAAVVCRKALSERCDEVVQQLLEFQLELCEIGDTAGHTLDEVLTDDDPE